MIQSNEGVVISNMFRRIACQPGWQEASKKLCIISCLSLACIIHHFTFCCDFSPFPFIPILTDAYPSTFVHMYIYDEDL